MRHIVIHARLVTIPGLCLGLCLAVCLAASMGCSHGSYAARFSPPLCQETRVVLKENDFGLIERDLSGSYNYWGIHVGLYPYAAFEIPLDDPRLFSKALANLYGRHGLREKTENKPTQLVNWTLDAYDFWIPIPYITPVRRTATFRADLMEFTK